MFKTWEKIFSPFLILVECLVDCLNKQGFMLQESGSLSALRNSSLLQQGY